MRSRLLLVPVYILLLMSVRTVCEGGIRGPGKYSGVVVFDRWDGCTLYSGIYVMYISEKAKEGLRKFAGQAVQIDAKEVFQPENPGDGLIRSFEYLGKAPPDRNWVKSEGIRLRSSVAVGEGGKPIATITIRNDGPGAVKLYSQELALTLLMKKAGAEAAWGPSDGPSVALITRQIFEIGGDKPRWEVKGGSYSWTIGKENALPHEFTLATGGKKEIKVTLDLPDGEYDFLCGYGGGVHEGQCVAGNLSAFDVKDGKATVAKLEGR